MLKLQHSDEYPILRYSWLDRSKKNKPLVDGFRIGIKKDNVTAAFR
jgi:hypothetical protein